MNRFEIGKVVVMAPNEWLDITDSLDGDMPFTLAKDDGVGVLQFSFAGYQRGARPKIELKDLDELRVSFAQRRGFLPIGKPEGVRGVSSISSQSYKADQDFLRVWYCSNGSDVMLVTYVSDWRTEGAELTECDAIVKSLKFDDADGSHSD